MTLKQEVTVDNIKFPTKMKCLHIDWKGYKG